VSDVEAVEDGYSRSEADASKSYCERIKADTVVTSLCMHQTLD
jgi:hypothetical protein